MLIYACVCIALCVYTTLCLKLFIWKCTLLFFSILRADSQHSLDTTRSDSFSMSTKTFPDKRYYCDTIGRIHTDTHLPSGVQM